jgi:hypothetical protein
MAIKETKVARCSEKIVMAEGMREGVKLAEGGSRHPT